MAKEAAIPLIGAEGDECRWRKIALLVRGQVDRVKGQLLCDTLVVCKKKNGQCGDVNSF